MSKIDKIEKEIRRLTAEELAAFRKWFAEFDGSIWDRQIEEDAKREKIDEIDAKALKDHKHGKSSPL